MEGMEHMGSAGWWSSADGDAGGQRSQLTRMAAVVVFISRQEQLSCVPASYRLLLAFPDAANLLLLPATMPTSCP